MVLPRATLAVGIAIMGVASADGSALSSRGDCFEYGFAYAGYDVLEETGVLSSYDCMKRCTETRGCSIWSWDRHTKACHLKDAGALTGRVPKPSVVSGPRQCVYGPTCFDHEWDYPGYDIEKIDDRFVISPNECQQLCTVNSQCAFFSWKASTSSCYLKASTASLSRQSDSDVVSGPKVCPSRLPSRYNGAADKFDPSRAPPACAEPNVEYRGYNVASAVSKSAHDCQIRCASHELCAYWTWNLDTHTCHLKGADAPNGKASDSNTLRRISAAKDCVPVVPGCQFAHVGVLGARLSTQSAYTYEDCQLICLMQQGCSHWTLDTIASVCTLWSSFAAYTKGTGTYSLVSGPVLCESEQVCFEEGDFAGYDIEKIETGEVRSPSECLDRCRANNECHFWTWVADTKFCYLKSSDAVLGKKSDLTSLGMYSGPKKCSITYGGCVKLNAIYQGTRIMEMPQPDYIACAAACKSAPNCAYWNYFSDHKHCQLQAPGASVRYETLGGTLSGTRYCPRNTDTADDSCFEEGIRYAVDKVVSVKEGVSSARDCYASCQAEPTCEWFSYVNWEQCYLLPGVQPRVVYDTMSVSGPSSCPDKLERLVYKGRKYTEANIVEKNSFVYTPSACAKHCDNSRRCKFWSYLEGRSDENCFLFDGSSSQGTVAANATSGEQTPRPFLARNCTFTKPIGSAFIPTPSDCQVECRLHQDCAFWSWFVRKEGEALVGICEFFRRGSRQVANDDSNSICGSAWAPENLKYNQKGANGATKQEASSISSCEAQCENNMGCKLWTLDTNLQCNTYEDPTTAAEEGHISARKPEKPPRTSKCVQNGKDWPPRHADSVEECQKICVEHGECFFWSYDLTSKDCSLHKSINNILSRKGTCSSGSRNAN